MPAEGASLKIEGSALVAYASSKEEILETLKRDVYADNGVWDFSKVSYFGMRKLFGEGPDARQIQIYPFKCAFRLPGDSTL